MPSLSIIVPTMCRENYQTNPQSWQELASQQIPLHFITETQAGSPSCLAKMQWAYEHIKSDILLYLHDDVLCKEKDWDIRVLKQFDDPKVGIVGFGGSLGHGDPDIYKKPYHISQLGRSIYLSNTDDWEVHGAKFADERDVATLDGFALGIRRELLQRMGGWPVARYPEFHCYDHLLTLSAHRLGYRVRLVGLRCCHWGGLTTVREPAYTEYAKSTKWGSDAKMHEEGHRLLYEDFGDALPVWVNP